MKKRKKDKKAETADAFDMVNKYGTYEIQPTADSENEFPKISQGLPLNEKNQ